MAAGKFDSLATISPMTRKKNVLFELNQTFKRMETAVIKKKVFYIGKGFTSAKKELRRKGWVEIQSISRETLDVTKNKVRYNSHIVDWNIRQDDKSNHP